MFGHRHHHHTLSTTAAGTIGNVMEWYDFALFGYFAPIIAGHFFPSTDQLTSLLQTYGVFAAGFVMRPLGGALFGYIGDRYGRSRALIVSVLMMGAPTFALGILPGYAQIGIWAPVLLVFVRLFQGVSVGGEFSSSVTYMVETARPGRRGLSGSWANFGSLGGTLLGSGTAAAMATLLPHTALLSWGWRIPFLLGLVLAGFAFRISRNLPDTHLFTEHEKAHKDDNPLHEAMTRNGKETMLAILFASGYGVFFYLPLIYLPTYANTISHMNLAEALRINALATAAMLPLVPLAGLVSDTLLRRKYVLMAAFGAMLLVAFPAFRAIAHDGGHALLISQLIFAGLIAIPLGTAPAMFAEMFPTEDRLTCYSIAFNVGLGLVGGTAPMVATWLIKTTHSPLAPSLYLAALSALAVLALWLMKDRSREPLL